MSKKKIVIDHPDLVRDRHTIVNTNNSAYMEFIKHRENVIKDKARLILVENELKNLTELVNKLINQKPKKEVK